MGDMVRADLIADTFTDRTIKALVRAALKRCGNCPRRIECSSLLLQLKEPEPIKAAALHLIYDDLPEITESSLASNAAAHFLKHNCLGGCLDNRMPRCVGYWLTLNGCGELQEATVIALRGLSKMDEDELALKLEAVLRSLGFTSSGLIIDASKLLLTCRAKGRYRNACSEDVIVQ